MELRIEELVLRGFAPADRYRIAEAVEGELARLLAEKGLPPGMENARDISYLGGMAFEVPRGARAEVVGVRTARSLYGGLAR